MTVPTEILLIELTFRVGSDLAIILLFKIIVSYKDPSTPLRSAQDDKGKVPLRMTEGRFRSIMMTEERFRSAHDDMLETFAVAVLELLAGAAWTRIVSSYLLVHMYRHIALLLAAVCHKVSP